MLGMMTQQLEQLVRLIDDLVDVSRITSGKLRLRSEPTQLADFIKAAVDQSRPLIESARHTLRITLPGQPLVIQGDHVRLAQIVSNLLINAAKYTPQADRYCAVSAGGNRQRDNGIGIPPEMDFRTVFTVEHQREHGGLHWPDDRARWWKCMVVDFAKSEGETNGASFARPPQAAATTKVGPHRGRSVAATGIENLLVDDNQSAHI
jgi:hypothetical protein